MNSGCFLLLLLATSVQGASYLIVNVPSLIILDGSDFGSEVLFLRVCISTPAHNESCNVGSGWVTGYKYIFPELFVELKAIPEGHLMINISVQTAEDLIAIDSFKTTILGLKNSTRQRIDSHTAVEFRFKYTTSIQCVKDQEFDFKSESSVYEIYNKHCDSYCRASIRIFFLLIVLMTANVIVLCCNICKKDCRKTAKSFPVNDTTASGAWLFGDIEGLKRTPSPNPNHNEVINTTGESEVQEIAEEAIPVPRTETIV